MSLTTNVKTIQEKTRAQGVSTYKPDIIERAGALGFDINAPLPMTARQEIADSLVKDASSQLAVSGQKDTLSRIPEKEVSLSRGTESSLAERPAAGLDIQGAAMEIRKLGNADQVASSERLLINYAMGQADDMETLKQLLAIIAETKASMYSGIVTTINALDSAFSSSLKDLDNQLNERNAKNRQSQQQSLALLRANLARVKNM